MPSSARLETRQIFFSAWKKHQQQLPLEPTEAQIIDIILMHPEYQEIFSAPDQHQNTDFTETNPFLHISLHIALHEQIKTNRPAGIKEVYEKLCQKYVNYHEVEHKMLDCLANLLWDAQKNGVMPSEENYLCCLQKIR